MTRFAIDTSALARLRRPAVSQVLEPLIGAGMVVTTAALDFESLFSARGLTEYRQAREWRARRFEYLPTADQDWCRALDLQGSLAYEGRLRQVGMADLLIAAVCERNRIPLLHYDADFETIASITGQDARWVVPRGSIA
ncbi:MAG TPA: PIN domain nuclease [Terrimesophilobacter sp.]|nr:PIN domain nuclease [Terrimesophilobacter sp.]